VPTIAITTTTTITNHCRADRNPDHQNIIIIKNNIVIIVVNKTSSFL